MAGRYDGDENSLPQREHPVGSHPYIEAESMEHLARMVNIGAFVMILCLGIVFIVRALPYVLDSIVYVFLGSLSACLMIFPHELLHAIWYKEDVALHTNFQQGLCFVVGCEDFSKGRFVWMCFFPSFVLGFLPFALFLFFPDKVFLGSFGLVGIGMAFGDFLNIYNTFRQVPKGAKIYLSGMHSYWYK